MSSQEEFGLQTNVEAHCADPQVVQPIRSVSGAWRDIARDNTHYCFPVLVSRPTGREIYTPTSAFVDATGVWRVYRSEGGNAPLPFAPSHWMPLPAPPSSEEQHSQSEPQASTGNPATDTINLNPLPPDIKEIVERHHNRHPWLQPGDRHERVWMLRFDDNDVRDMVWIDGDAEEQARKAYAKYSRSWNCYLFAVVPAQDAEARAALSSNLELTAEKEGEGE